MPELPLGGYIRQQRRNRGMTQEQLCEGICDTVTLSRIENGKQTPSRARLSALLERLGLPMDRIFVLLTQQEQALESLEKEIIDCNIRHDTAAGLKLLRELEATAEADDPLTQQLILRSKALLGQEDGSYTPEEQLEMLLQAIRLTNPRFQVYQIKSFLYSLNEVKVLNQIANTYSNLGQHDQALAIFSQLLDYIQSHFQSIPQSSGHLSLVAFNYALELATCKRYEDAIAMAELGRSACIKYGHYQFLPGCIHIIAECAHYLGDDEKSRTFYRGAYSFYVMLGDTANLAHVREEINAYFGPAFQP